MRTIEKNNMDFEKSLEDALKSGGYLFPETDEQMSLCEKGEVLFYHLLKNKKMKKKIIQIGQLPHARGNLSLQIYWKR